MNLVLARACSNSCPYCFETGERDVQKAGFVSHTNATRLAIWARDSGLEFLSLLGGEPFLHPDIHSMVSIFRKTSPATFLTILTGGIFKTRLLDSLSPDDVNLIFNVNEPRDYKEPEQYALVLRNIANAIHLGFRVTLGFNVWRLDFDIQFMPSLARKFARTEFRWTVANPQRDVNSNVVKPVEFDALAERCFMMLKEAAAQKMDAMIDCPLPLCFFTEEQLAWARQYTPGTVLRMGVCDPPLDVTPELEAVRCFPLSGLARVKVTDFRNEEEIRLWFRKHVDSQLIVSGCYDRCAECPHMSAGRCYGGCLAWHNTIYDSTLEPGASQLAFEMNEEIESGKPEAAISRYESSNYWSQTAVPSYLAATAATRLGKWDQALHYGSYALSVAKNPDIVQRIREVILSIPRDKIGKRSPGSSSDNNPYFVSNRMDR